MRVARVCLQTVCQIRHKPLAICRLEVSDTREAAAEVFGSGGVLEDPLHVVEQRFHIVKLKYSVAKGKQKCPYGRTVVTYLAAENSDGMLVSTGKPLFVYGEGLLTMPQWSGQQVQ